MANHVLDTINTQEIKTDQSDIVIWVSDQLLSICTLTVRDQLSKA